MTDQEQAPPQATGPQVTIDDLINAIGQKEILIIQLRKARDDVIDEYNALTMKYNKLGMEQAQADIDKKIKKDKKNSRKKKTKK